MIDLMESKKPAVPSSKDETPLLDALLWRVRAAVDRSGRTQIEIAAELGISTTQFNEYLPPRRKYRPNGEVTLRMERWVEHEERISKK